MGDAHERAARLCSYCAKLCRHTCPLSNVLGSETLTPQMKMEIFDLLRHNTLGWSSDLAAVFFACTGCGLCQQICEHDNDVEGALWAARAEALRRKQAPAAIAAVPEQFRRREERLTAALRACARAEWFDAAARILYLPGCDTLSTTPDRVDNAFAVFRALDVSVTLSERPLACVGYPLWAAGAPDAARLVAERVIDLIRDYEQIVLGCAACTYTLRRTLPAAGFALNGRVLHLSEFLSEHSAQLPVRRRRPEAYYHDPCYLGRHLSIYDEPRAVLDRCVDFRREFFHARERSECCGGGGLVPLTYPAVTAGQAKKRLAEPSLHGVDLVVTACSGCTRTLQAARTDIDVLDLVDLVAWAIAPPPGH
jgi:Fe-S oxidoreductase